MVPRFFLDRLSVPKVVVIAALALLASVSSAAASSDVLTLDGTPVTISTTASGEKATLTFTGTAGQRVSLKAYGSSMHSPALTVKKGTTVIWGPQNVGVNGLFTEAITLPTAGTYSVVIAPPTPYKGSITVAAWDVPADTTDVIVAGSSNMISLGAPGQTGTLTFAGTAGQRISLRSALIGTGTIFNVSIKKPDGTVLVPAFQVRGQVFTGPVTLPTNGTYTIFANPPSTYTGAVNFDLWTVPADQTGTLTLNGAGSVIPITTPGQGASYTFAGTAGAKVTLLASDDSLTQYGGSAAKSAVITIKKPDGTLYPAVTVTAPTGGLVEPFTLPTTGTYTVTVNPASDATGSITLTLFTSPADAGGSALTAGTPTPVTIGSVGQNAAYTFAGTAGQKFALNLSNVVDLNSFKVAVYKPLNTGSLYPTVWTSVTANGKFFEPVVLPVTGIYTVKIDPSGVETGTLDLTAYTVAADTTSAATLGTPAAATVSTPGEATTVTFAATAGQRYSILLDQLTLTGPLPQMKYTVSTPTGTALYSSTFNAGVKFIAPFTAAVTGTYKIKLDPGGANTGSVRVGVYQIVDTTGTVTLGSPPASPVTFTTAYPGQNGSLTFTTASANQRVAFWFEDSTYPAVDVFGALDAKLYSCTTPACTATTLVVAGGKSQSFKVPGDNTSLFRDAITLPTAGTYKWTFDPLQYTTGNFKLWAYAVPAPATAPLVLASATPATATTTVPGQTVTFTFSNTTARTASFIYDAGTSAGCVGNITVGPVVGAQIFPASTSITYEMGPSDQLGVPIPTTPTATNYQVTFDPADTCIGAVSFFMN